MEFMHPSVLPSSTTINSMFLYVCDKALSSAGRRYPPALYTHMTTLTSGFALMWFPPPSPVRTRGVVQLTRNPLRVDGRRPVREGAEPRSSPIGGKVAIRRASHRPRTFSGAARTSTSSAYIDRQLGIFGRGVEGCTGSYARPAPRQRTSRAHADRLASPNRYHIDEIQ